MPKVNRSQWRKCATEGCDNRCSGVRDICIECHRKTVVWKNKYKQKELSEGRQQKEHKKMPNRFTPKEENDGSEAYVHALLVQCFDIGQSSKGKSLKGTPEYDALVKLYGG